MDILKNCTDPEAEIWQGYRLAVRQRLAQACQLLLQNGQLQRSDIVRIGEVSLPQASIDLRLIVQSVPDLMEYDKSRRCYVRKGDGR